MPSPQASHEFALNAWNHHRATVRCAIRNGHSRHYATMCPQRCMSANETSRQFALCSPARSLSQSPTSRRSTVQERLSSVRTCIRRHHHVGQPNDAMSKFRVHASITLWYSTAQDCRNGQLIYQLTLRSPEQAVRRRATRWWCTPTPSCCSRSTPPTAAVQPQTGS